MSFEPPCAVNFSIASRKAEASSPAVMRPFRSIRAMPSRSLWDIARLMALSFRVLHMQGFHAADNHFSHSVIPEPFVVGRDHVPRRIFCAAARQGILVRLLIFI